MERLTEKQALEWARGRLLDQIQALHDSAGTTYNESVCLATTVSAYVACVCRLEGEPDAPEKPVEK